MSPQWEGGLELDSDNDYEDEMNMKMTAVTKNLTAMLRVAQKTTSVM